MWQRIFKPLNLADTTFPTVDPYLRGPHAKGYLRTSPDAPYTEITTMTPSESWTAGAIVATASDVDLHGPLSSDTAFIQAALRG